jgi:3-deoxy-D-manno-octulosonate 8-phosphate phosphatase (KDO 8-P phosphatase)
VPSDSRIVGEKAARIRLLLFDVDGVLTDGTILVHPDGSESKRFHIRDGTGIVAAHRAGLQTGLLSGRASPAAAHRAAQLGMAVVRQDAAVKDEVYLQILRELGLADADVAYMGDDILDLAVLGRVGLSAAPADAAAEVRARVDWVSRERGGHGAAREFVELVLGAQHRWDAVVRNYAGGERTP